MVRINRRRFITASLAGAGLAMAPWDARGQYSALPPLGQNMLGLGPIVDTNVYVGRWPLRRVHGDQPDELVAELRANNVIQAWASHLDGVFHKDISGVNERLAEICAQYEGFLVPFGVINPNLVNWEEDLRRVHEDFGMPGIRLFPNYHWYDLDLPQFQSLLATAAERDLVVQLAGWMEDWRQAHPRIPIDDVNLSPLSSVLDGLSLDNLKLMVLNAGMLATQGFLQVNQVPLSVPIDIARLEYLQPLNQSRAQGRIHAQSLVFGSYFPMFNFEAALLKLAELEQPLTQLRIDQILHLTAGELIPRPSIAAGEWLKVK